MSGLKDIAAKTGLSMNTVSRALRDSGYVSASAREKVICAAKELGYAPNRAARSLRFRKNFEIGVITFIRGEDFYCDALHMAQVAGIKRKLMASGYELNLHFAYRENNTLETAAFMDEVLEQKPAGLIIMGLNTQAIEMVKIGRKKNVPSILISSSELKDFDCIYIDRAQGVRDAVCHMAEKGRRNIAFVGSTSCSNRLRGYREAIKQHNLNEIILVSNYKDNTLNGLFETGLDIAEKILRHQPRPDAIQAYSDYLAAGILAGFHRAGIKVPDDIAVSGFDNRELASFTYPPLTTVAQPSFKVGEMCTEFIIGKIERKKEKETTAIRVPMKLEIRQSA
ncbi:MAG: hypothetical protein A2017_13055 [Lentisphaerae bacterium GWF2_44_16]|nr:MAG: hypothetical protein A2017_13055 [Lentisphaerae bacterium GWF2_44_16]